MTPERQKRNNNLPKICSKNQPEICIVVINAVRKNVKWGLTVYTINVTVETVNVTATVITITMSKIYIIVNIIGTCHCRNNKLHYQHCRYTSLLRHLTSLSSRYVYVTVNAIYVTVNTIGKPTSLSTP